MIYSLLIPLFFALLLQIPWILFAMLIVVYPLWLMVTDIKRLKKELREIKEENTAENNAEASAEKKAGTEE